MAIPHNHLPYGRVYQIRLSGSPRGGGNASPETVRSASDCQIGPHKSVSVYLCCHSAQLDV